MKPSYTLSAATAFRAITVAAALPLAGLALSAPASAEGFPAGNAMCFEISTAKDGAFDRLKLVAEPAAQATDVLAIHGVEKGTWMNDGKPTIFFNELSGTGTVAAAAAPDTKGNRLFIGLTGNGSGYRPDAKRELWALQYALDLDPASLKGTLLGFAEQSGAIQDGKPYKKASRTYLLKDATPIDCSAF